MRQLDGKQVTLKEGDLLRREQDNRVYMMKLENQYLLRNYLLEAGRISGRGIDLNAMGGWEDPSCQLRGHFLGHWLSAAAMHYHEVGDKELWARAYTIVEELEICQNDNGGKWVAPIPEKYLYWIGMGRNIWAPQYNMHKLFMGLVDVYKYMDIELALTVADKLADWFYEWSGTYSREEFDNILDVETGGMLEVWSDLLEITKDEKYRTLLERYYRGRLFEPLLEGKDVLTNMHANTTIPEILGCARAYEVTGEEKWYEIVKAYWNCAVTERGYFATGGQTQGEVWTPKQKLKARLGDKNQEHCTVYNMIRLADFLFRYSKDPKYMHYVEYNIQNGLLAQTYWRGDNWHGKPGTGLITYFLPMKAASYKDWAGEMDSFFCCHGTMIQSNAAWNRYAYYQDEKDLYVTMYINSEVNVDIDGICVKLIQQQDYMNGSWQKSSVNDAKQTVNDTASEYANKPDFRRYMFMVECEQETTFTLHLRVPDWITNASKVTVNGEEFVTTTDTDQFVDIARTWKKGDLVEITFPIGLRFVPLPDDETTGAFRYGADVLAGITEQERVLFLESEKPEDELSADTERQWGDFRTFYRTENQDPGISFTKLNAVGYEPYQIYFKVKPSAK
ncbi:MAG: glycoside hydrolase family 127 protein [Eubacteriales bacterium]|nr:glycoside hydrolase family 127 protein [Eubacteriales bacterium]